MTVGRSTDKLIYILYLCGIFVSKLFTGLTSKESGAVMFTFSRQATLIIVPLFIFVIFVGCGDSNNAEVCLKRNPVQIEKLTYPESRMGDQVDTYHGIDISDPYRWLEDVDSDETHA